MEREQKEAVVDELREEFREAGALLVADPRGLDVGQLRDLRVALRAQGASFRIAKNTLARIAARDSGSEPLIELLTGPTGIALCREDPAPVAKAMADFARQTRLLEPRGGLLEGRAIDADGVKRLASLPSRQELIAQLVGGMAAPISGFVGTLAAIPRGLVVALDQIRQQREAAA